MNVMRITFLAMCVAASATFLEEPVSDGLAKIGHTTESAVFNLDILRNYGGDEFRLPYFELYHRKPWGIPNYTAVLRTQLEASCKTLPDAVMFAGARIQCGVRRTLLGDPTQAMWESAQKPDALKKTLLDLCGPEPTIQQQEQAAEFASGIPAEAAKHFAYILMAQKEALEWRDRAFAELGGDLAQYQSAIENQDAEEKFSTQADHVRRQADLRLLFAGAADLAFALERALPELARTLSIGNKTLEMNTPAGKVRIFGSGNDRIALSPTENPDLLLINTGGNDTYVGSHCAASPAQGCCVLIDFGGDDVYTSAEGADINTKGAESSARPAISSAQFGLSFLIDLAGEDTYTAVSHGLAAATFGIAVLADGAGNDSYNSRTNSQAAAAYGAAVLVDRAGDDRYTCFTTSQAFAATTGCAILADLGGDDWYLANDTQIDYPAPQSAQHNASLSQGSAFGRRADYSDGHSMAGGVAILFDKAGNDRYSCGIFGQGVGYWYALGMLLDGSGDDTYSGVWYVQGAEAHYAVGVLVDFGGSDKYTATMNMAQGAGHDFGVGYLLDAEGNDVYTAPNLSLGGGNANGIGIFWDLVGDDSYSSSGITLGQASQNDPGSLREFALCLGFFLDTGGADTYGHSFAANNNWWVNGQAKGELANRPTSAGIGLDTEWKK